jgi:hypothetical protein
VSMVYSPNRFDNKVLRAGAPKQSESILPHHYKIWSSIVSSPTKWQLPLKPEQIDFVILLTFRIWLVSESVFYKTIGFKLNVSIGK